MKFPVTPLALALMAGPLAAQTTAVEKRIADLEKKVAKLGKADEAKDSGVSVKFGGRFHLDAVNFSGADNRLPNGAVLRRARISFKVGLGKNWAGEGDVDFAEGSASIKDMWIGYEGFENSLIQLGQFKQPMGFDTLSSSNATWLMERSYSDIWAVDRHVGIAYSKWGNRWQGKVAFFGEGIDDINDAQADADTVDYKIINAQGKGFAARASFAPVLVSSAKAVHFGVAVAQRTPNAAAPETFEVDFSGRPEQNKVSRAKFLNAKVTNVKHYTQTGVEFVGVWGPFSWQSEYQVMDVKRRDTQMWKWDSTTKTVIATSSSDKLKSVIDHTFSTYYAQVSWLFGGQRTYEPTEGLFGKVAPSKNGALELVARYSVMDQDDLTTVDPIKGGEAKNITLGLTYYLNKNVRFMLNHTMVDNNENAAPSKSYSPTGVKIANDDFSFTAVRMQVNF